LFLGSAPGNDFVIGKKTTNSTGSFEIRTNGITTILALTDSGILRLPTYGAGGITGSPTYRLAVDASGAIIEVTDGGGTVTGTGTANYLSKWSGTSSLTNSIAYDDGSKLILNGTTDPNIGDASTVVKLVINGDQHFSRQSAKIYFGDVTALQPLSIGEGFQADSGLDKDFMSIYHRNKLVILGDPGPGGYYPTRVGIGKTVPGYTLDISNDNITYNRITSFWSGAYMSGWLFSDQNGGITYDAGSNTLNLFANWGTDGTVTIQTKGTTKVAVLGSGNLIVGDGTTDDGADYRIQSRGSILVKGNVNSNYSFYNGVYASSTSTIYGQFVANWESPGNWGIGSKGASDSTVYIGNANSGVISAGTFRLSVLGGVSATGVSFFNSRVNIGGAIDDIDIGLNVSAPSGSGKYIMFGRNSSNVAVFSLSDTGAGSFLGNVTINKTTPGLILNGLGSGNSGAYINFQGWAVTNLNWQIGVANIGPAGLLFTPSTAAGGTTFSSPVISFSDAGRISSVGLSSTASITSTGPLSFSGTSAYIYQYGRLGEPNTGCIIYNNGTGANMFFGEVATSIYGFGNGGTGTAIAGTSVLSFNMGGNVGINIDSPAYSLDVRNASTASTIIANFQAAYDALNEYGVIRIGQGSYNAYFGQMLQTYDVAFMGMTTPAAGNGIYYSTANKAGINTIQPLSVLHTTGIGYTTANLAEVYNSPNSIRVTPRSDSAISLFVGLHIGTNVVGISAASSATESKNISLQTFGGAVAIGKIDPTATLDLAGNFIVSYSPTFSTNGNISEQSTLTMSIPASSSFTSGGTWAASTYTSILTWQGSSSINAGAVTAGFISVNRHSFSTSSTITLSQSGSGIRAVAGLQVLQQTGGTVNGTISHGASLFVQGIYPSNTANVTFTNYYGLLINNLTEWGGVTLGTRYGIYQAGTSDTNYFAAQIIAQGSNGALSVGGSGYTLNPTNMLIGKYTTGRGYIQVPDNGQVEIWDGPTTAFITFKSASTKSLNPIYSTYTKSMATPNGGTQTVRIIEDALGQWILVGRFAANAMSEIQGTWSTVRGLSTSTSQSTATAFSADFGDAYPTEVRVMGATDFDNWRDTRTIDFVYRVPAGRQWQTFFNGGNTDGTFVTSVVPRYGWDCAGTYDGFGRWNNPLNTQIGMADGAYTNPSSAYTTPSSGAIYWNGTGDAKMSVIHTGVYSGQDTYTTSAFGADDAVTGFFDVYPTTSSNMAAGNVYSSAVWILIKLN